MYQWWSWWNSGSRSSAKNGAQLVCIQFRVVWSIVYGLPFVVVALCSGTGGRCSVTSRKRLMRTQWGLQIRVQGISCKRWWTRLQGFIWGSVTPRMSSPQRGTSIYDRLTNRRLGVWRTWLVRRIFVGRRRESWR